MEGTEEIIETTVECFWTMFEFIWNVSGVYITFLLFQISVNQAESRLEFQSNSILQAMSIQNNFKASNEYISAKQQNMRGKLGNLNNIVAQMPFTTQFSQMAYSIYHLKRVSGETTFQTMFTVVQFDLNPLSRNGVVWVLLSTPISKVCTNVKGLSKKLPNFLVLWLTNLVKMVWIQRFSSCFRPMLPLYPLKALGNRRFSCVFRGCKMVILAWMS